MLQFTVLYMCGINKCYVMLCYTGVHIRIFGFTDHETIDFKTNP